MEGRPSGVIHANGSASLVDVIERILDKGVVIAGDIKIKIVDIELLTIQVRLLICSVDKAREMGMDWWMSNAYVGTGKASAASLPAADTRVEDLGRRISALEAALGQCAPQDKGDE